MTGFQSNQPTVLRFYDDTVGGLPPIRPQELASVVNTMESCFERAAASLGFRGGCHLVFAQAPRRACLEIAVEPLLSLDAESLAALSPMGQSLLEKLGTGAAIAGAIWIILFGGEGVVKILRSKAADRDRAPWGSDENRIKIEIAMTLSQDREMAALFQSLARICEQSAAIKTTMELPGEPEMTIYSHEQAGHFYARSQSRQAPMGTLSKLLLGGARSSPVIRGEYKGQPVRVVLSRMPHRNSAGSMLTIWTPSQLPTRGTVVNVVAWFLTDEEQDNLRLFAPLPPEFDDHFAVILVQAILPGSPKK